MNVRDMTDAEVYELGLQILLDRLGSAGRVRFLRQCKPCTGDYTAERHKWIDDTTDIKTVVKRIQEKREQKQAMRKNESSDNISEMSDIEVYELGLKAISSKLGPLGIVRFVHLFDTSKNLDPAAQLESLDVAKRYAETSVKDDHDAEEKKELEDKPR